MFSNQPTHPLQSLRQHLNFTAQIGAFSVIVKSSWTFVSSSTAGYDMQPPLTSGVYIQPQHALNNPAVTGAFWTVEVALPIDKILERSIKPDSKPGHGDYWRINFSRVEWRVIVEDDIYVKDPSFPHEDNWVWSPQGEIAMHLPERWGFLQFSEVLSNRK